MSKLIKALQKENAELRSLLAETREALIMSEGLQKHISKKYDDLKFEVEQWSKQIKHLLGPFSSFHKDIPSHEASSEARVFRVPTMRPPTADEGFMPDMTQNLYDIRVFCDKDPQTAHRMVSLYLTSGGEEWTGRFMISDYQLAARGLGPREEEWMFRALARTFRRHFNAQRKVP